MTTINLSLDDLRQLLMQSEPSLENQAEAMPNPLIGEYVIVRCKDAGVHAGILAAADGRSCVLNTARRLWYWKPANGAKFLSGVANHGLHPDSKISESVSTIVLTENCEIIATTETAENSIRGIKADAR